jgi:hypothetical protein
MSCYVWLHKTEGYLRQEQSEGGWSGRMGVCITPISSNPKVACSNHTTTVVFKVGDVMGKLQWGQWNQITNNWEQKVMSADSVRKIIWKRKMYWVNVFFGFLWRDENVMNWMLICWYKRPKCTDLKVVSLDLAWGGVVRNCCEKKMGSPLKKFEYHCTLALNTTTLAW